MVTTVSMATADGPGLPTSVNQEFKPFVRRLPEFKFWSVFAVSKCEIAVVVVVCVRYSGTRAVAIAFVLTFFSMFNIPVFWPILVLYFIILFSLTMKRQIMVGAIHSCYTEFFFISLTHST